MILTHEINMDLMDRGPTPIIEAVQDDRGSRRLAIRLLSGGAAWTPPADVKAILRYIKADGRGGEYDTLPDGSTAWSVSGNVLTVTLAPQVLNVPGTARFSVELLRRSDALHTFQILINVRPDVKAQLAGSENYKAVAAFLPAPEPPAAGQYVRLGQVDAFGRVLETEGVDLDGRLQAIRDTLDAKGDCLAVDPETGLLHLMRGGEKLDPGVELGQPGPCINGGWVDAGGYLHLTLDGMEPEGFRPVYVGGESDDRGSVMTLESSLESRVFSIAEGEAACVLPYTWSSVDGADAGATGPGRAVWTVNSARAAAMTVAQGAGEFDVRPYLASGGENTVRLTVWDAYGACRSLVFIVTVAAVGLGWSLADMACHGSEEMILRLRPSGAGTVKVTVDGVEALSQPVGAGGKAFSVALPARSHGAHIIEAWAETETAASPRLRHVGVWLEAGNETPVAAVLEPEMTVGQYGTVPVKFLAVVPGAETADASLAAGEGEIPLTGLKPVVQTWHYTARQAGDRTLTVRCGGASAAVALHVQATQAAPVTAGLLLDMDPGGRSNSEVGRENFGFTDSSGVCRAFAFSDNFDWLRGGFQTDEAGVPAFVVRRGCHVTAHQSLFADDAAVGGKTIRVIFKTVNVRDPGTVAVGCMSGGVGMTLGARQAVIGSQGEAMTVDYAEEQKIELDICIRPESEDRLAFACLKGVPACPPVRYAPGDTWAQAEPELLTIGSDDADVWIYRMKVYGTALTPREILDNHIADCGDPGEMAARLARNDIYGSGGAISPDRLVQTGGRLRTVLLRMASADKADVEILCPAGGESHHLIARDAAVRAGEGLDLELDLSAASEWVDGNGTALAGYAFTGGSMAVSCFALRAELESSGCADDVLLGDDYDAYNPVPFAGKYGGVRDWAEGHPCVVFVTNTAASALALGGRTVAAGETVLYFAGNMANSADDAAVYGMNSEKWPKQCCVEPVDMADPACLFRSTGTGGFRFVFPQEPTDQMREALADMQAWVVSTAPELATGEPLAAPAVYGGVTYDADTGAYRQAKFLAELEDYFIPDQLLFHYLFTRRHCLTANRGREMLLCRDYYDGAGGYRWTVRRSRSFRPDAGWDMAQPEESVLWANIAGLMHPRLQAAWHDNREAWDGGRLLEKYRAYQSLTPEAVRLEDLWGKYITPLLSGDEAARDFCLGTGEHRRSLEEGCREAYLDSEYLSIPDSFDCVTLRADAGDLRVTADTDVWLTATFNDIPVRVFAGANTAVTVPNPLEPGADCNICLYPASRLRGLHNLHTIRPRAMELNKARALRVLDLGSILPEHRNTGLTAARLQNLRELEYLDLRGLPNVTGMLDLSEMTQLEEFYAVDCGLTGLAFAQGAPVWMARVPPVETLIARDLVRLRAFAMAATNLTSLQVENCPGVDTLALCRSAGKLARGRVTGVDWTDDNADVLLRLAQLKDFVLMGKAGCAVISRRELERINAAFPALEVSWGQMVPDVTVSFCSWDGSVFTAAVQVIRQGGTAQDPVAAGLIDTPARPATVEEEFTFSGWDGALTDIAADTVRTAVFTASTRYYHVRFWSDTAKTTLLQYSRVAALADCPYEGAEPVGPEGTVFAGWDCATDRVDRDLDVHALFEATAE